MYYWTEDDVFNEQSFFDFINNVWTIDLNKSQIELIWVDHTFWKIWWDESELPYKQLYSWIKILIKEWTLISWWRNMLPQVNNTVKECKNHINDALFKKYSTPADEDEVYWW